MNRPSKLTLISYSKTGRCRIVKRTMDDEADRCKFPVSIDQFPVRAKTIPGSESNRESAATHWNCRANRRKACRKGVQDGRNSKNSLLFSLLAGNRNVLQIGRIRSS